jgi:hypothetical protein
MGEGLVGQPALPAQVYPEQAERAEEFRHPLLGFETFGSDGLLSLLVDLFITPVCPPRDFSDTLTNLPLPDCLRSM